jgi:hypothetical protein
MGLDKIGDDSATEVQSNLPLSSVTKIEHKHYVSEEMPPCPGDKPRAGKTQCLRYILVKITLVKMVIFFR